MDNIVDDVVGRSFEFDCSSISLRGRDDSIPPFFCGPGSIFGRRDGRFSFRLHNTRELAPAELMALCNASGEGTVPMCLDARDYHDQEWTGGWFNPIICGSGSRCFVTGEFPQLTTDVPLTNFDRLRNSTVNHYHSDLRLPMLETLNVQEIRGGQVERVNTHWDRPQLDLGGASIIIATNYESQRTSISTTHKLDWSSPYCEVGLADALAFVCATSARPRVTIRYFDDRAIVFIRETPTDTRSGLPRPIAYRGPHDHAFWNLFLAFLGDCKTQKQFYSTRLSRLFSELVLASTGTVHAVILSLVIGIEDIVEQITGPPNPRAGVDDLKNYLAQWSGDRDLKHSAIALVGSSLARESTRQHLRKLADKGVVTCEQIEIWDALRPRLAHGKITNYDDEQLMMKRNQLIMMFYRLVLRLLGYQGEMSDHTTSPPDRFSFEWTK